MKKTTILAMLIGFAVGPVMAQKKITEKDLLGSWKLILNVEKEIRKEIDDEDNALGRFILKSVASVVENFTDELDVVFIFEKRNKLTIVTNVFDEHDIEHAEWSFDENGELVIDSDDHININNDEDDEDDVWRIYKNRLVMYDLNRKEIEEVAYFAKEPK